MRHARQSVNWHTVKPEYMQFANCGDRAQSVNCGMMRTESKVSQLRANLMNRMRERRRSLGITQEQLAERSGLSANYIATLETGARTPSFAALAILADALEAEPSDLLAGNQERPWAAAAAEVARVMASLDEHDAAFMLTELQNIARYLKSRRSPPAK